MFLCPQDQLEYLNLRDGGLKKKGFLSFIKKLENSVYPKLKTVDVSGRLFSKVT